MFGPGWTDTVLIVLAVGLPIAAVWWLLRKPVARGSVPRDMMAARAKATDKGAGLIAPAGGAYRATLIDQADDADHDSGRDPSDPGPLDADTSDFEDTPEHRAEVVRELRSGR